MKLFVFVGVWATLSTLYQMGYLQLLGSGHLSRSDLTADHGFIGKRVRTAYGWTHYALEGPANSAQLALLYGRGFSDGPDTAHTAPLFTSQIAELLFALNITHKVHLVGTSMGAAVVSVFADQYPTHVASLTLISPAGLPVEKPFLVQFLSSVPVLDQILLAGFTRIEMRRSAHRGWSNPDDTEGLNRNIRECLLEVDRNPALRRALLSTLKNFPLDDIKNVYRSLGSVHTTFPVNAIWSIDDATTPFHNSELLKQLIPRLNLVALEVGGHSVSQEFPVLTARSIVSGLSCDLHTK
eukprot:gnl/Spiro4/9707_TR5162_c0_g1_i1.p1 gnl/Spiro4/9707_TR5162_c0_g1~~gnl/Spiro4/9707_TR5162_c0_g1_i1.p1  ORF type:complete len:296 (+),score=13.36 gnl/Spiro4/9707_TR5162_c0_g1_i1:88-975(+)